MRYMGKHIKWFSPQASHFWNIPPTHIDDCIPYTKGLHDNKGDFLFHYLCKLRIRLKCTSYMDISIRVSLDLPLAARTSTHPLLTPYTHLSAGNSQKCFIWMCEYNYPVVRAICRLLTVYCLCVCRQATDTYGLMYKWETNQSPRDP